FGFVTLSTGLTSQFVHVNRECRFALREVVTQDKDVPLEVAPLRMNGRVVVHDQASLRPCRQGELPRRIVVLSKPRARERSIDERSGGGHARSRDPLKAQRTRTDVCDPERVGDLRLSDVTEIPCGLIEGNSTGCHRTLRPDRPRSNREGEDDRQDRRPDPPACPRERTATPSREVDLSSHISLQEIPR